MRPSSDRLWGWGRGLGSRSSRKGSKQPPRRPRCANSAVTRVQGYLYSKVVPASEAAGLLSGWDTRRPEQAEPVQERLIIVRASQLSETGRGTSRAARVDGAEPSGPTRSFAVQQIRTAATDQRTPSAALSSDIRLPPQSSRTAGGRPASALGPLATSASTRLMSASRPTADSRPLGPEWPLRTP